MKINWIRFFFQRNWKTEFRCTNKLRYVKSDFFMAFCNYCVAINKIACITPNQSLRLTLQSSMDLVLRTLCTFYSNADRFHKNSPSRKNPSLNRLLLRTICVACLLHFVIWKSKLYHVIIHLFKKLLLNRLNTFFV